MNTIYIFIALYRLCFKTLFVTLSYKPIKRMSNKCNRSSVFIIIYESFNNTFKIFVRQIADNILSRNKELKTELQFSGLVQEYFRITILRHLRIAGGSRMLTD